MPDGEGHQPTWRIRRAASATCVSPADGSNLAEISGGAILLFRVVMPQFVAEARNATFQYPISLKSVGDFWFIPRATTVEFAWNPQPFRYRAFATRPSPKTRNIMLRRASIFGSISS
jgi:hypothetical protein